MTSKVIQVIEAIGLRGVGTPENPHRYVTAYFSLDGDFLAESDPFKDSQVNNGVVGVEDVRAGA